MRYVFVKKRRINICRTIFICLFLSFLVFTLVNIRFVSVIKARSDNQITVALDPGHGGYDPGKVGGMGTLEKNVNLQISLKLRRQLENEGYNVVMTRENDNALNIEEKQNKKTSDLRERVHRINESGADILLSIHQNSYIDVNVKGAQVFFFSGSEKSHQLAKIIQDRLVSEVDCNNKRREKGSRDYYILKKSKCPGVIIECGFLSCGEEEKKLIDVDYQDKLVNAIVGALNEYYKNNK